jgi:hypothetical protein
MGTNALSLQKQCQQRVASYDLLSSRFDATDFDASDLPAFIDPISEDTDCP